MTTDDGDTGDGGTWTTVGHGGKPVSPAAAQGPRAHAGTKRGSYLQAAGQKRRANRRSPYADIPHEFIRPKKKRSPDMEPILVRVTFSEAPTDALSLLENAAALRRFCAFPGPSADTFALAPITRNVPRPELPCQWTDPETNITLNIVKRAPPPPEPVTICTRVCVVARGSPTQYQPTDPHVAAFLTTAESIADRFQDWDAYGPQHKKDQYGNKEWYVYHRSRVPLSTAKATKYVKRSTYSYAYGSVYTGSLRCAEVPPELLPRHSGSPPQDDPAPTPTQHASLETAAEVSQGHPNTDPLADSQAPAALHEDSHSDAASSGDETQGPPAVTHSAVGASPRSPRKRTSPDPESTSQSSSKRSQPHPQRTPPRKASALAQDTTRGLHTGNPAETDTNMPVDTPMDDSFGSSPSIDSLPLSRHSSGGASQ